MLLYRFENSRDEMLSAVLKIYEDSFPESERRPIEDLLYRIERDARFSCRAAEVDGRVVGLLTTWDLGEFVYVEHLAVDSSCRGMNIGSMVMEELKRLAGKPIILEIEPVDEPGISVGETIQRKARLRFYARLGFHVCSTTYLQPPYAPGLPSVPLVLLESSGNLLPDRFDYVKNTLYTEVYGV